MAAEKTIDLYHAISEMKRITVAGGTFSIKFRKWNRTTAKGGDLAYIRHAKLRAKPSDDEIQHASHKLFVYDDETGRNINCWECLVVEFNGMKTILV